MLRFALTDAKIKAAKPGHKATQLTDGMGLYLKLFFDRDRGHSWRFDYTRPTTKKRNTLVFGAYPTLGLKEAREQAQKARELIAQGIDPGEQRDATKAAQEAATRALVVADERKAKGLAAAGTLQGVCEDYQARNLRNGDWTQLHADQWLGMLKRHVFPRIGLKVIGDVTPADVLGVVEPLETAGMDPTSRCVRKYLVQVFDYAMVLELCKGNPAHAIRSIVKKNVRLGHNAAVTKPDELRAVLLAIREWPTTITRAALQVQAALFQRPANTCAMEWAHLDLDAALWTIPAAQMKGKRDRKENGAAHVVPLPSQVVAILRELHKVTGHCAYVFESPAKPRHAITNDTLTNALRNMGLGDKQTAHGFRATARTMLVEQLHVSAQVVEAQLAHQGGMQTLDGAMKHDPLGKAYNRATFLDARKAMVQQWADYLDKLLTSPELQAQPLPRPEPLQLAA